MTYYYNKDSKFQPESSVEYKTQKGAVDRMNKEGEGAVFDETGQLLISLVDEKDVPEGALDTDADGNVPAYNEKNEQVGTVDAGTAALASGESLEEPGEDLEEPAEAKQSNEDPEETDESEDPEEDSEQPDGAGGCIAPLDADGMEELAEGLELRREADVKPTFRQHPNTGILFTVHTTCDMLRIRSGAGHIYRIVGYIEEKPGAKKEYDIVEEKDGFGKLADGSGWICLEHTARIG